MGHLLGQNQYGKAETRVVRITRDGAVHHIEDLTVSVSLSGAMDAVHYAGDNAAVLPTDTVKNTVYAFAKEHGIGSAERFGIRLARHFVTNTPSITTARVRVEEHAWERIGPAAAAAGGTAGATGATAEAGAPGAAEPAGHSFVRSGRETRTARVVCDGGSLEVVSGLADLAVLNSTGSEFRGFRKDRYTTLRETADRVLATRVHARWRHRWSGGEDGGGGGGDGPVPDWDASYARARDDLLTAFAGTYSRSLQQTLYAMGSRVLDGGPGIDEIRLSLPNLHHFPAGLEPFGLANEDGESAVYLAADRPYGLIEATVLREGAQARIPAEPDGP